MISAYYCFKSLSESLKKANFIRSENRLDCIKAYRPEGHQIKRLINSKGQTCFYPSEPHEVVKADTKRYGIINLTNSKNFSAIFIPDLKYKEFGYGDYENDALLFIVNSDLTKIEILFFEDMRSYCQTLYQKLIDGDFDESIAKMREEAEPIYNYKTE